MNLSIDDGDSSKVQHGEEDFKKILINVDIDTQMLSKGVLAVKAALILIRGFVAVANSKLLPGRVLYSN